ncbi:MAG TPA: hypothetical protein VGA96_12140, partial [Fibrella sp.]
YRNNQRVKADTIPDLRNKLKELLPKVAGKIGMPLNPGGTANDHFLETILDKFFLKNGLRFLEKHFTRPAPGRPPV